MRKSILIAVAACGPLACWAADQITPFDAKPGLWETTSTTEIAGLPVMPQIPPEALARMPPERRAQVEAMMKSRNGPQATTTKSCMTPESFRRALNLARNEQSCTSKLVTSSSSKQEVHVECAQGKSKSSGDVTIERIDSEHAKGNMTMKSLTEGDRPINMDMKITFNSKWLSSDCGDVKPFGEK